MQPMEIDDPKQVVLQVGSVLKKLRKDKGLSLEELAQVSGVSKLTLGNIERGDTNPTIGMLWRISKSLSVPLMALFSDQSGVQLSRAGEGLRIAGDGEAWVIEPIFQQSSQEVEMCRAYLQPNSSYYPEMHHPHTTEIATVMSGMIEINVNDERYTLNAYDTISFRADDTHSYTNPTNELAVLHLILRYN
ncbi:XRE family transcriptional regulator [Paenibacillus sp. 1011MAR3C5]|nr:XRE family transcriptional regulator [Paenibacillus sp. 1011MAR3C5]